MARIAISYRRADSSAITGRIYDRLVAHFGKNAVFMDVEDIPVGVDFRDHIRAILRDAEVLLVIIGPHWAAANGDGPSRLRERADPVRLELEEAFARQMRIVPVLIEGAVTPASATLPRTLRALSAINAAQVRSGRDFNAQMSHLIGAIDQTLSVSPAAQSAAGPAAPQTAAARHDHTTPQGGQARAPRARDLAPYYVILPALLLLVGHYTVVNWLDLDVLYLRVVCFAVPFGFGFVLLRHARTGFWASLALAAALAILAVAAMTVSEGLNSGQPILPETRQEWQDNIAFVITIAGGFMLGWAVARVAMQVMGGAEREVN